jgi:LmbE family N-acetylglucosaminyl deacetylase
MGSNDMFGRLALMLLFLVHSAPSQVSVSRDAAHLRLALKKLTVLGSVLYIAAHPDDENTAFLAAMSQGRCYRTAYLSCTRGEGGQNLIGPEQGELLGVLRTQELLAARRIDGAEQYFTRAIDFGYSKTTEETLRFWGKEKILSDIVWVIRKFRPDVIVTRFTPELGGHGNHTASALLADEAFRAAADSTQFPEQLRFVAPWQAKRIVWNVFRFSPRDTVYNRGHDVSVDLGAYSPILGESFTEIAGESRSMHKSQGFGAAQNRGDFLNYFQPVEGDTAKADLFDGINTSWSRVEGGTGVGETLENAYKSFNDNDPAESIPLLMAALRQMSSIPRNPWIDVKKKELVNAILACGGMRIDATTPGNDFAPGSEIPFTATVINRSAFPFTLDRLTIPFDSQAVVIHSKLETNRPITSDFIVRVPKDVGYTQPYWLRESHGVGSYDVADQSLIGRPENKPPLIVSASFSTPDGAFEVEVPLRQRIVDPVQGELLRPVAIVPPVTVDLQERVYVFPTGAAKKIRVSLKAFVRQARGSVHLRLPKGWSVSPAVRHFELQNKGDEEETAFSIKASDGAESGEFVAEVETGNSIIDRGIVTVQYSHISPQALFPRAEGTLLRIDLRKRGQTVGYVMGAGDEIPPAIRQMGYSVDLLSDKDLEEGNLARYDVIVAGVRAYNTRSKLRLYQNRLLKYVERGGTYVVQYATLQRGQSEDVGPYPLHISHDRVTDEDAPVTFVDPKSPVLTTPNRITEDDFNGWVQERGLYFADRWDSRYDSVLACNDRHEPPRRGGLLVAKYGKGYYVYCAYAFFRQLPAGVGGAYRLFANILSLRGDRR